jgi:hypothetical protein
VPWTLTFEEYDSIVDRPCTYCGQTLDPCGVGIDQKVPGAGYTLANSTAACGRCNALKGAAFSYEEALILGLVVRLIDAVRAWRKRQPGESDKKAAA